MYVSGTDMKNQAGTSMWEAGTKEVQERRGDSTAIAREERENASITMSEVGNIAARHNIGEFE